MFVFGSNDYFAPTLRNPLWYLFPDDGRRNTHTPKLPWRDLRTGLERHGWTDLTNTTARLTVRGTTIAFAGSTTRTWSTTTSPRSPAPAPTDVDLRLGVAHAPYLRVLDQFARTATT